MSMVEDILIRIKGEDQTSGVFSKIKNSSAGMKVALGGAMTAVGATMAGFAKDAVSSAISAESEWNRFGAAVNSTGGNWDKQSAEIKSWVSNYSNSMGRGIADTRSAMTALMNYGLSAQEAEQSMSAVSGMAAAMGTSQEEASNKIVKAFAGQGRGLKTLGINLDDYKDSATGAIDKQRLLTDITNKTKSATTKYANSTEADMNRINQSLKSLKTDFGKALLSSISPLIPVVQGLLGVFNGLPGPVKTVAFSFGALVAAVGLLGGPVMTAVGVFQSLNTTIGGISGVVSTAKSVMTTFQGAINAVKMAQAGLTATEVASAAAHAGSTAALTTEAGASTLAASGFLSMAAAELVALAPIILIVAAIAGVILVIEQLGEYMGWWSDWGSMVDAFTSGIQRLWDAFVNSPQVQGTLQDLQSAFNSLKTMVMPVLSAIGGAWNSFLGMLGSGTGSDPVGAIISSFGRLGSIAGDVVNAIKRFPQTLQELPGKASSAITGVITAFAQLIARAGAYGRQLVTRFVTNLRQLPQNVRTVLNMALTFIRTWATQASARMIQAGVKMLTGLVTRLRQIPSRIKAFFSQALSTITSFGANAAAKAKSAGKRILQGIVNNIKTIPARVSSYMSQVPARIASAASAAVSAATSLATQVVTAVANGIKGVAEKVYTEFMNIPAKIKSAVSAAVSAATSFGENIKNAVLNALHIASPGIIQKKIALEFANIPGRIDESRGDVFRASQGYATGILNGFSKPVNTNIGAFRQAGQTVNNSPISSKKNVIVNFHEGSIPINANNLPPKDCQAIVINAIESLDVMKNSNIVGRDGSYGNV